MLRPDGCSMQSRCEERLILEAIPSTMPVDGERRALDLGGGTGVLRRAIEERGYRYVNLDLRRVNDREPSLLADAHRLPFRDAVFDLVISKSSLQTFPEPDAAVREVRRVLKTGGHFVIWVPWL